MLAKDERRSNVVARVLASLVYQVTVERLYTTRKGRSVVLRAERLYDRIHERSGRKRYFPVVLGCRA